MSVLSQIMLGIKQIAVIPYLGTFTRRSITSGNWSVATYFNNTYFVYGVSTATTTVPYSTDGGATWNTGTGSTAVTCAGAATNGSVVVLCKNSNGSIPGIYYSSDGINFSTGSTTAINNAGVAYGPSQGLFVTVGGAAGDTKSLTSPDGINWTLRPSALPALQWSGIVYGNGIYMAFSVVTSVNSIATSSDGINWTSRSLPTAAGIYTVTYGGGRWIATQNSSSTYYYSTDNGANWTAGTFPAALGIRGSFYLNGNFIMPVSGTSNVYTSADGINWTSKTLTGLSGTMPSPKQSATNGVTGVIGAGGTLTFIVQAQ